MLLTFCNKMDQSTVLMQETAVKLILSGLTPKAAFHQCGLPYNGSRSPLVRRVNRLVTKAKVAKGTKKLHIENSRKTSLQKLRREANDATINLSKAIIESKIAVKR